MPQEHLEWGFEQLDARAKAVRLYRDYYEGRHRLLFATERFRNTFGRLFRAFADNLCPAVVHGPAERLRWTGYAGDDGRRANELWATLNLQRRSGDVHLEAFKVGDQFVIVWRDSTAQVRVWPQEPDQVAVLYDQEDDPERVLRAIKVWVTTEGRFRANLYYPDVLERWVSRAKKPQTRPRPGGFVPFEEDDQGPVVDNPLDAVPVFHFANGAAAGAYGRSHLTDVVPLQDALNKTIADLLVGQEFAALPQRWATGVQEEIDPATGRAKSPWVSTPGGVWTTGKENARMGTFPAAELSQLVTVADSFRLEIARVSSTPMHEIQLKGEAPSGEALKVMEARRTALVEDRQLDFGRTWVNVGQAMVALDAGRSMADVKLEPTWAPAATRDELHEAQVVAARQAIHGSWKQACRELGFDEAAIVALEEEKRTSMAAMGEAMLAQFDRGPGAEVAPGQFAGAAA